MIGHLYKTETDKWFINSEDRMIPLHPEIINDKYENGDEVEFIIVDEFTHPDLFQTLSWGEGTACAWIVSYSEKTINSVLNTLFNLEKDYPNDMDLGRKVRNFLNKIK